MSNPIRKDVIDTTVAVSKQTNNILSAFFDQNVLTEMDLNALNEARDFALASFTDTPMYRPMVVKLASVLSDGQFPTPDAKFWQCKAEAEVHFNELVRAIHKLQALRVDIDEIDYKITSLQDTLSSNVSMDGVDPKMLEFELRRFNIKKESFQFEFKLLEKNIKYRIEEVADWGAIAEKLTKECKYDTKNKYESLTESIFKRLEYEISRSSDETSRKKYEDQLNTLKRLLTSKAS